MLDITDRLRNPKQVIKTIDVRDIYGTFVVKLGVLNIENDIFNTQLPLNEYDNKF